MSWLIPKKREERRGADNIISGVSILFRQDGEDVVVEEEKPKAEAKPKRHGRRKKK